MFINPLQIFERGNSRRKILEKLKKIDSKNSENLESHSEISLMNNKKKSEILTQHLNINIDQILNDNSNSTNNNMMIEDNNNEYANLKKINISNTNIVNLTNNLTNNLNLNNFMLTKSNKSINNTKMSFDNHDTKFNKNKNFEYTNGISPEKTKRRTASEPKADTNDGSECFNIPEEQELLYESYISPLNVINKIQKKSANSKNKRSILKRNELYADSPYNEIFFSKFSQELERYVKENKKNKD